MSTATCIKDYNGIGYLKDDTDKSGEVFGSMIFVLDIWMLIQGNILNSSKRIVSGGIIMKGKHEFVMIINGNTGCAEVRWIPDNKYSVAHYAAFISVPFKDCRWEHLFIYDKSKLDEAIEKAKKCLKSELQTCTLVC